MTDDDTFSLIQEVYSKYFSRNKTFKMVWCTEPLKDERKEAKIINDYHKNNNHKGINETLLHLKRENYFPYFSR